MRIVDKNSVGKDIYWWKYLDLHKFINFLFNESLYFTRISEFEDVYEGLDYAEIMNLTIINGQRDFAKQKQAIENNNDHDYFSLKRLNENFFKKYSTLKPEFESQNKHFVNCWFKGENESLVMWKLYSQPDGVAIKVKSDLLYRSIKNTKGEIPVDLSKAFIGTCKYRNFIDSSPSSSKKTVRYKALRKIDYYNHEAEVRIVFQSKKVSDYKGFPVKMKDFKTLPIEIYTHPTMADWKLDNIKALIEKTGNNRINLNKSRIKLREWSLVS